MKTITSVCFMLLLDAAALGAAETFTIDTVHSSVMFRVKHMNMANFYGRFNDISGTFVLDKSDMAKSSLSVQIKSDSVDTGNAKRDSHLKSPDFFSVKEFPVISFKSKEVKAAGEKSFEVSGDLTLHGVTKSVTLKLEQTGSGKDPRGGGSKAGFESTFAIKRSEFGMKFGLEGVSDEVQITVSVECSGK